MLILSLNDSVKASDQAHDYNQQPDYSLQLYSQRDRHGRRFATGEQQLCYSRTKTVFPKIARWVFKDGPLKYKLTGESQIIRRVKNTHTAFKTLQVNSN